MNEITARDIWDKRRSLEDAAATHLGYLLFGFSRLELLLGSCLASDDGLSGFEDRIQAVEAMTFFDRLTELKRCAAVKFSLQPEQRIGYEDWINRANTIRRLRNAFIHGRWNFDPQTEKVVNLVGLPSDVQYRIEYSLEQLADIKADVHQLHIDLQKLTSKAPL